MTTTKTILSRALFLLYLAAIGFICFVSSQNVPDIQRTMLGFPTDKVIHFGMFLPFQILAFLSFDHPSGKKWKNVLFVFISLMVGVAIAMGTEVIQSYLPTRGMDLNDFKADALALGISTVFVLLVDLTRK